MSTPTKKTIKDKLKEVFAQVELAFSAHKPVQGVAPVTQPNPVAPVVEPAPTKMDSQEYTTNDGTVLSIDNLAVGGVVTIAGTPAPDGEYTLQDGTVLQVQSGFISSINAAAADPDEDDDVDIANIQTPEQFRKAMQKFMDTPPGNANVQDLALMVKALMEYNFGYELRQAQQQASQQAAINAYKTNFEAAGKAVKELVTVVQEFAEKPIVESIEDKGVEPVTAWQRHKEARGEK